MRLIFIVVFVLNFVLIAYVNYELPTALIRISPLHCVLWLLFHMNLKLCYNYVAKGTTTAVNYLGNRISYTET